MAKKSQARVVVGNQPKVEQLLPSTELLAYYKARVGELINQPPLVHVGTVRPRAHHLMRMCPSQHVR
jgi:hypothetical protein